VERPKIGGIVGIGVHSDLARDPSRLLVVESILSTLLNVVGSVKAIYKYTRDLEYYATRDPLTHLYNQRLFWELLHAEVGRAQRAGTKFALLVIDCDNFKEVNDRHGHAFGDHCLQQAAEAIRGALRKPDMLARYGGDEFAAILPETGEGQPYTVGERVREALGQLRMRTPDGHEVGITVSIGLGVYPDHAGDGTALFQFADDMMYRAKHEGKNRLRLPSGDDVAAVYKRIGAKGQMISRAIEERRVIPYFQPLRVCAEASVRAFEVLSRIDPGPGDELLGASEFIAAAEQMGLVHELDFIAIDKAFELSAKVGFEGLLFFNLSPRNLALKGFLDEIKRLCAHHRMPPQRIVFEIEERDVVRNTQLFKKFLNELKADGFSFAIDAFGSAFSSFQSLRHFPLDYLRIDSDYVVHLLDEPRNRAFVRSIVLLAHELDIVTIAGFIEDEATLRAVAECGIDLAQGFHIGRPQASPA
jgi:diguanylate cyclase (GGDEF)-like protein